MCSELAVHWLQIENQAYPVNVDALHTVFNPYGFVQKIACFEKNNTWQVSFQVWPCTSALFAQGISTSPCCLSSGA